MAEAPSCEKLREWDRPIVKGREGMGGGGRTFTDSFTVSQLNRIEGEREREREREGGSERARERESERERERAREKTKTQQLSFLPAAAVL